MDAAKRYRVDTEKIQKAVAEDFGRDGSAKSLSQRKPKRQPPRVRRHFGSHLAGVSLKGNYAFFIACPLSIRDEEVLDSSWLAAYSHRELNHLHVKESAHRRASE